MPLYVLELYVVQYIICKEQNMGNVLNPGPFCFPVLHQHLSLHDCLKIIVKYLVILMIWCKSVVLHLNLSILSTLLLALVMIVESPGNHWYVPNANMKNLWHVSAQTHMQQHTYISVFHMHAICQFQRFITLDWKTPFANLVYSKEQIPIAKLLTGHF